MKSENIIKRLKKEGYKIEFKKWSYWDSVPHVEFDTFSFAIAEHTQQGNALGINLNFIYNEVLNAISTAERINKILDKSNNYSYDIYKIYSMEDYYRYKKDLYPYNELWHILQKINTI